MMDHQTHFRLFQNNSGSSQVTVLVTVLWIISVALAGFIGYSVGQNHQTTQTSLGDSTQKPSIQNTLATPPANMQAVVQTATPTPAITTHNTPACPKGGFAQKWEYLTTYVIKQNDTLQSIAQDQLGDPSRTDEILQINGVGPLVVGATLYLPPASITKSSGNLKEVYGKLNEKDSVSWRVDFSNDPNGQGLLIPTFWFEHIANANTFTVGDCVKIFFDDGDTVYSVALQ